MYVLELEKGNYYVGHTKDLPTRIAQHFLGQGANWTKLHRPLRVLSVTPGSRDLETAQFAALCCQKTWQKCRGAGWCIVEMTGPPPFLKKAEQWSASKSGSKPQAPQAGSSTQAHASVPMCTARVGEFVEDHKSPERGPLSRIQGSRVPEPEQAREFTGFDIEDVTICPLD